MNRIIRRIPIVLIAVAVLAGLAYAFWPRPVQVELARIERGPLRVYVEEDGMTRIKEKYAVSAPLAGRLARVILKAGDAVTAGETILAAIDPSDPSLLDPRARAEAQARIRAAEAALERAQAELTRSGAALELAQTELARVRAAFGRSAATKRELDEAATLATVREQESRATAFALEIGRFELEQAKAALLWGDSDQGPDGTDSGDWRFEIRAPVSGRVLRVFQESAAVVQAGTPLMEIGDPSNLEIVVDVLSRDAVAIRPGAAVIMEHWGGEKPLNGRVRLVEPAAFTKISALGVEEQRVNVVIDLIEAPDAPGVLGDGYRVEANVLVWEADDVLVAPSGALFRQADRWAVFAVEDDRAVIRPVEIGRRSGASAQIREGLQEGAMVIVYPSDRVQEGTHVTIRQ